MRAVALDFEQRAVVVRDVPEPALLQPDEVLFRVHEVGVCGTDRELAHFHLGTPPAGESFLTLGHEALGQVVAIGPVVTRFQPGDWMVPTVRRACAPPCSSCMRQRRDLCLTGRFIERGIWGLHGFWTGQAVEAEEDLLRVPPELVDVAVLVEPLSSVEKVIERAFRLREAEPARTALVLGAGPIGILAALAFHARGLDVTVYSREEPTHVRARIIGQAGVRYVQALSGERADIILEATGSAAAASEGIVCLKPLGVMAVLGIPAEAIAVHLSGMIFGNHVVFGSVNASPQAFATAIEDLARFDRRVLRACIERVRFDDVERTLLGTGLPVPKPVHVIDW